MNNEEPEQIIHLSEYYYVLRKHKWTIISSFILIVSLTMFYTYWMKPVYRATATIVIEKEQTKSPLTGENLGYEGFISQTISLNTHLKLITSRPVLDQVIKNLRLDQLDREKTMEVNPLKELLSQFKENIRLLFGKEDRILTPEERQVELTEKLKEKIDIEAIRETIAMSGITAILVHSIGDFNLHIPANALLFTVLTAVVVAPLPVQNSTLRSHG